MRKVRTSEHDDYPYITLWTRRYAYAKENRILKSAEVVRLIANAYTAHHLSCKAIALMCENLDAQESYHSIRERVKSSRLVDCLIDTARAVYADEKLAQLFVTLLVRDWAMDEVDSKDLRHWYDELCKLVGGDKWVHLRTMALDKTPPWTVNILLAHEGSLEELYD